MKESKLPTTETTPAKQSSGHHTFRNIMLLILFALAIWSWFHYLPQHAMDTMSVLNERAGAQIDKWMGVEPTPTMDYSLMLPPQAVTPTITTGEVMSGETNTGTNLSGTIIFDGMIETGDTQTGTEQTGTNVWDEIDAKATAESTPVPSTGENQITVEKISTAEAPLSITIGGQTIALDGTPDEDIVINGNGYTITVQKN